MKQQRMNYGKMKVVPLNRWPSDLSLKAGAWHTGTSAPLRGATAHYPGVSWYVKLLTQVSEFIIGTNLA